MTAPTTINSRQITLPSLDLDALASDPRNLALTALGAAIAAMGAVLFASGNAGARASAAARADDENTA